MGHGLIISIFAIHLRLAQRQAPLPHVFIVFQKIYLKPAKSAFSPRSRFRRVVEALRLYHAGALEGAWKFRRDEEPGGLRLRSFFIYSVGEGRGKESQSNSEAWIDS